MNDTIHGPTCWYCDSTEELSPRERSYDSAPLGGWECKECRDASREYDHKLGQFEIGALLRDQRAR
jgi:hypothetical protein